MKPARFDYLKANDRAHAVEALAYAGEDARILAGGQSLMAVLNMRLASPRLLIDVSQAHDLASVRVDETAKELVIGAAATQASVEMRSSLPNEVPLLAQGFPYISHMQIRSRGTVCGSIAHADPSAELPLILTALGGRVTLSSARGSRSVAANDLFRGMLMTDRQADELIESAHYPLRRPGQRFAFREFSARHGDFALVACAGVVTDQSYRLCVGGVADRAMAIDWPHLSDDDLRDAINDFSWQLGAQNDANVSASYRRHLVRSLGWQVLKEAS